MSILQLRKNFSHDESMLAVIVVIEKGSLSEPISTETLLSLHEHHDSKQDGQIIDLFPPGEINHKISFMLQTKSPTTNKCHAAELQLVEFYEKLNDLLTVEFIRPAKALVSDHSNAGQRHQAHTSTEEGRQKQTTEAAHVHAEIPSR